MPDLNEPDVVLPLSQRLHDAVDAVAGQSEDDLDAPVVNRVDEDVSRRDRQSVVQGKSVSVRVDLGGSRLIKQINKKQPNRQSNTTTTHILHACIIHSQHY